MLAKNSAAMKLTLPSDREFAITRVFNAPRRRLFEAWTRPEHVKQWYGCSTSTLLVCEIDLRIGGAWRYTMRGPDGANHTMQGVYREIIAPDRLVYTEQYVTTAFTSNAALVTVTFVEQAGKTTLTSTVLHGSREDRDAHLNSGVESGAAETLDRLAQHLAMMS